MKEKLRKCRDPMTVSRALLVAAVVGTVLNLINHFELLLGAPVTPTNLTQMVLTYMVPYVVSMHGQVWWNEESAVDDAR